MRRPPRPQAAVLAYYVVRLYGRPRWPRPFCARDFAFCAVPLHRPGDRRANTAINSAIDELIPARVRGRQPGDQRQLLAARRSVRGLSLVVLATRACSARCVEGGASVRRWARVLGVAIGAPDPAPCAREPALADHAWPARGSGARHRRHRGRSMAARHGPLPPADPGASPGRLWGGGPRLDPARGGGASCCGAIACAAW